MSWMPGDKSSSSDRFARPPVEENSRFARPSADNARFTYQRPLRDGSAYAVISHGNDVLVGRKRDHSRWQKHREPGAPIFNNTGQFVFPGGGYEIKGNESREDATKKAALREFTEETGLDIDLPAGRIFMNFGGEQPDVDLSGIVSHGYHESPIREQPYGALHMQVPNRSDLDNIVNGFNQTAGWDNAIHNAGSPYNKWKEDDELRSLHVLPADDFMWHLKNMNENAYDMNGSVIPKSLYPQVFGYNKDVKKDSNTWFQNILRDRFPRPSHDEPSYGASSAAGASAASSSGDPYQKKKKGGHMLPPYLRAYFKK